MAYPQNYVAVPKGKMMTDLIGDPAIAAMYSDVSTVPAPDGCKWIKNAVDAANVAVAVTE